MRYSESVLRVRWLGGGLAGAAALAWTISGSQVRLRARPTLRGPAIVLAAFLLGGLGVSGASASEGRPAPQSRGDVPEFHAFLDPELICDVFVGDSIEISFDVDETAVQFNGYELSLHWGPTILDYQSVAPGVLMTEACPTDFENVVQTDSTLTYTHVILCADVSVNGPGRLSTFHFDTIAPGMTEVTITSDPDRTFLDAGLWVRPTHATFPRQVVFLRNGRTTVVVNDPSAGIDADTGPSSIYFRVLPNPAQQGFHVELRSDTVGPIDFGVFDANGRVRLRWTEADAPAVYRRHFDLFDASGSALPGGTYFVRMRRPGAPPVMERLVVVR